MRRSGRRTQRPWTRRLAVVMAGTLAAMSVAMPGRGDSITSAEGDVLGRERQLSPEDLGSDPLEGLQYADPTERLSLIEPPEANNQGNAELSYPLLIPRGRADLQPSLALTYDSSGGNGWVGVGWDLDLGAVTIDTRWGAPRYDGLLETETYVLDGDVLSPTAVASQFEARVAERDDFTRRVEGPYERIVRHGTHPSNYWWEVTDKLSTTRYYGGTPEGERDPSAILSDGAGNAYRWALSGVQDISGNVMRLSYEAAPGERVGADHVPFGTQLYLDHIRYTGSIIEGNADDPAYEVRFLRDDDISPTPEPRPDVLVDGSGGLAEVTSDLLRRVEVWYGEPNDGDPRTYDQLVTAYNLRYGEGAFEKSLLLGVDQLGSDGLVYGSHEFDYYDDVRSGGEYEGFGDRHQWQTGENNDISDLPLVDEAFGSSALGSSLTVGADVHAYLGFNPLSPGKATSIGGALTVNGGVTEALAEFIDLNGDQLPDKVYRDAPGADVKYRLNQSGPDGGTEFGGEHSVGGLDTLTSEFNVGFGGAIEAHFVVAAQFNIGATLTFGEDYFADVNSDGLPDFVTGGRVMFNHLDPDTGEPTFEFGSSNTRVPIDTGSIDIPDIEALQDLEEQQRSQSPLVDTVRRWVAPYTGVVRVTGAVRVDPTLDPDGEPYDGDGVRVAVQHAATELWATTLTEPDEVAVPDGVDEIFVFKGQAIYFRVGSIDDGVRDQIRWNPVVTYTSLPEDTPTDVNALDQRRYSSAADFTLAGRPGVSVGMPLEGTVRFEAELLKSAPTTDDLTVLVLHDGVEVLSEPVDQDFVGPLELVTEFPVGAPDDDGLEQVEVRIAVDSPIDVTALSFAPRLFYVEAFDDEGAPVPTVGPDGQRTLELVVPYDIDLYPTTTALGPVLPSIVGDDREHTLHAEVAGFDVDQDETVVLTVKSRDDGLVAKQSFILPAGFLPAAEVYLDVFLEEDVEYYVDLSTRSAEPIIVGEVHDVTDLDPLDPTDPGDPVPFTFNRAGQQGIFPLGHRGWAYAGYDGDGARATAALVEEDFIFDPDDYPDDCDNEDDCKPHDFEGDDPDFANAMDEGAFPYVATAIDVLQADGEVISTPVWRGFRDSMVGGRGFARSSRRSAERMGVDPTPSGGASARAPLMMGLTGPTFALVASLGPVSFSAGLGQSVGLVDFSDLNGDGFPDVLYPGSVQYTGPRGGFYDSGSGPPGLVNADTSFAIGGGFSGSAVEIKGNAKGDANTSQNVPESSGTKSAQPDGSASTGDDASGDEFGASVGAALSVGASVTNPVPGNSTLGTIVSEAGRLLDELLDIPYEQDLADVNGDGLPDRINVSPSGELTVRLNLGYSFSEEITWADDGGGFENGESYNGSIGPTLGFSYNNKEFSGGLSLNESIDFPRYSWADLDGDGVLDRLRKQPDGNLAVAFGSGAGLHDELDFGNFEEGSFELVLDIPTGEQVAQGHSRGLGVGADFTISIGPLCTVACYLIVNPGAHAETSLSNDQVQLVDVNGDGYPDSVSSDADEAMHVRLNTRGRTNMLAGVDSPLGGRIDLDYTRQGNTVEQPHSQWVLSSVAVNDGRSGDGPDVQLSTYTYEGNRYDPLEREVYGYATVTQHQHDTGAAGSPVLRSFERTYANDNVFVAGKQLRETLLDSNGDPIKESEATFEVLEVGSDEFLPLDAVNGVTRLTLAGAPVQTAIDQRWFDGGAVAQETRTEFSYDALGNVTEIHELGELEVASDDTRAVITYPDCTDDSWVSVPATLTIYDHADTVLRHRDGSLDLCVNSVPIELKETIGNGEVAVTELTFDSHGNYNHIVYPPNADGERLTVDYVYDPDRVTDIATVTDSHGLTAELTYDGPTGLVASRTDPNGQTTSYTYDALGRVATATGPYEQGTGHPTITYGYAPTDADYAHATAAHFDAFHPADPIVTVAFVDGIGRLTQTKADGTVFQGADQAPEDVMIVAGAVNYDALGRPVEEYFPIREPLGTVTTYNSGVSTPGPTKTGWTLTDRVNRIEAPSGKVTEIDLGYGDGTDHGPSLGATLFQTTVTDPLGKQQVAYSDVRDLVWASDDAPAGAEPLRTSFDYDGLGQLLQVTDPGGALTTHTYDLLGRRTSTDTPDGGLRVSTYDTAGNVVEFEDAVSRAAGQVVTYDYDFDRLVGVHYQDGTPDVSYAYGGPGAEGNGAGRVIAAHDGARDQTFAYDRLGAVARETSTMLVHNLNLGTEERATFTTAFSYEAFGRLVTLEYPDGEVLQHGYDSGGLLRSVSGSKGPHQYPYVDRIEYDEFGDRRLLALGNGAVTTTSYQPATRWLDRVTTITPQREIQDLVHSYDLVGNVTAIANEVPPPKPELMGGPSSETFNYDPYHRLVGANGEYHFGAGQKRFYEQTTSYDRQGNLTSKHQLDEIQPSRNPNLRVTQQPTTYDLALEYTGAGPHQVSRIGTRSYSYDLNGNATGWTDDASGQNRTVTYDAEDRATSVADQGSTTQYTYDSRHRLAIERGPAGETAFVNQWYTVLNGTVAWKHIFAGNLRVTTQRVFAEPTEFEHMRFFHHNDSLGSVNLVTDANGLVFQHLKYFPSGEIWVQEQSDEYRTPYRYTGAYYDEFRQLLRLGTRWYEPREQRFYSPDPVLYDDPDDVIGDPNLLAAYAYAQANPLGLVDPNGRETVAARASLNASLSGSDAVSAAAGVAVRIDPAPDPVGKSSRTKPNNPIPTSLRKPIKDFAEKFEAAPLVEVNLSKDRESGDGWKLENVKVGALFKGLQRTVVDRSEPGDGNDTGPDAVGANAPNAPAAAAAGAAAAAPAGPAALGASGENAGVSASASGGVEQNGVASVLSPGASARPPSSDVS